MTFLRKSLSASYHIWYYTVQATSIILISPFIYVTSRAENTYHKFFRWSKVWARMVMGFMGFIPRVKWDFRPDPKKTYIIVANHSSEVDIMMTYHIVPSCFLFIGKKELARLPLFGYFYKKTNILVDRSSIASKRRVLQEAAKKLEQGIGVCIYPEGGIPTTGERLAAFKDGAFKLAIEKQIPILPITYPDNRRRFPDFGKGGKPGMLRATVHPPIDTNGLTLPDLATLRQQCFEIIDNELIRYQSEK